MANWDKLNKEFDDLLADLTDRDWAAWFENRETNKEKRRKDMNEAAKKQADKIHNKSKDDARTT